MVGKDSGVIFNLEVIFRLSVKEDLVCFSVGTENTGLDSGLISENVADRIY